MFRRVKREPTANRLSDEAEPNKLGLDDESRPNELDLESDDLDDEDELEDEDEEELDPKERARRAAELQAELQRQAEEFGLTGGSPEVLYGPNGAAVAELLDALSEVDDVTAEAIAEAFWAVPEADRKVARSVVGRSYRGGELELELQAAERAVTDWLNALDVDGPADLYSVVAEAATDAVDALVLEDELEDIDFDTLYGPWGEVMDAEEGEAASPKQAGKTAAAEDEEAAEEGEFGPNHQLVTALLGKVDGLKAADIARLVAVWREQPKEELRIAHRNLQSLVDEDPKWREQLRLAQEEVFSWMAGRSALIGSHGTPVDGNSSFGAPSTTTDVRRTAGPAIADAIAALVMADILEPEDAEVLYAPWAEVIGTPDLPRFEDESESD